MAAEIIEQFRSREPFAAAILELLSTLGMFSCTGPRIRNGAHILNSYASIASRFQEKTY